MAEDTISAKTWDIEKYIYRLVIAILIIFQYADWTTNRQHSIRIRKAETFIEASRLMDEFDKKLDTIILLLEKNQVSDTQNK